MLIRKNSSKSATSASSSGTTQVSMLSNATSDQTRSAQDAANVQSHEIIQNSVEFNSAVESQNGGSDSFSASPKVLEADRDNNRNTETTPEVSKIVNSEVGSSNSRKNRMLSGPASSPNDETETRNVQAPVSQKWFQSISWKNASCYMDSPMFCMFGVYTWLEDTGRAFTRSDSPAVTFFEKLQAAYQSNDLKASMLAFSEDFHQEMMAKYSGEKSSISFTRFIVTGSELNSDFTSKTHQCLDDGSPLFDGDLQLKHVLVRYQSFHTYSEKISKLLKNRAHCHEECDLSSEKNKFQFPLILIIQPMTKSSYPSGDADFYENLKLDVDGIHAEYDLVCIGSRVPGHAFSNCKFNNDANSFLQKRSLVSYNLGDRPVFTHNHNNPDGRAEFIGNSFSKNLI